MLGWLLKRLERKEVGDGAGLFLMWRYPVLKTPRFSVYLHEFLRSDRTRCLHDHPWPFVAIVLRGGYIEHMPDGPHWRRAGSILFRKATASHRIEIKPDTRPLSLVIVGKRCRAWGFWTPAGWKEWTP